MHVLFQHSMLYFFHHYELPVILQQAQLQQLLMRTHRGMGMMGLTGFAALASGAAYHDAPGTATQATPPTTQSTTQTVQNTAQSTTQTSPSVSTAQTNTTHTGEVISSRTTATETNATGTNTVSSHDNEDVNAAAPRIDKDSNIGMKIEEIGRFDSRGSGRNSPNSRAAGINGGIDLINMPSGARGDNASSGLIETTLDRRRNKSTGTDNGDPPNSAQGMAPRASPESDDLD